MYICNMKKNTLLYLDKNLVEKAKHHNLNLSEIAENAIRLHLKRLYLNGEEDFKFLIEMLLLNEGACFYLPFELKDLELKNIGPFSNLNI